MQHLKYILCYLVGLVLFYEPFMFFRRLLENYLPETSFTSIHVPCARIPLANLVTGGWQDIGTMSLLFCTLLAIGSLILGPFFCGRLCPAGALGEYLSKLVPSKYKINWLQYVPVAPLRYGFLGGFIISLWFGLPSPCAYCNYYCLEMVLHWAATGQALTDGLSLALTFTIIYIILGMFTLGGRGYCNFFCPVGAASSLLHMLGRALPFAYSMQVKAGSCIGCGQCAKACPMVAISLRNKEAHIEYTHCITCGKCIAACPTKALAYRRNKNEGKA